MLEVEKMKVKKGVADLTHELLHGVNKDVRSIHDKQNQIEKEAKQLQKNTLIFRKYVASIRLC